MSDTIMKLRYIITSLVAVCLLAIGCTKTYPSHLENIQLSQSTIGLDAEAQRTVTVDVTANAAWKIQTEIPSWLSVSPTEGSAGKTTVTFAAIASSASCNKATLTIDCGGQKQYVYVQQGKGSPVNTAETAFTPDEAIDFYQDGKNKGAEIYVKGVVTTSKIDLAYGNAEFYLEATKGTFEFYRCFDFDGEKFTDSQKVQPGDIIVAVGAITNYNSTIELGEGCKLVSIEKSNISVCNDKVLTDIPSEGAVVDLQVIVKGEDLKVKASNDQGEEIDWVSVRKIDTKKAEKKDKPDTTIISVAIAPNVEDVRTATFAVSSETSTVNVPVSQKSGLTAYPLPYSEKFDTGLGAWEIADVKIPEGKISVWAWDSHGYVKGTAGVKADAESYVVSPLIDLSKVSDAHLSFDHVQRYAGNVYEELTLWASGNNGETWEQLLIPFYSSGTDWNFVNSGNISLKAYSGKQLLLKFRYVSNASAYATWEIKNLLIEEGTGTLTSVAEIAGKGYNKDVKDDFSATLTDAIVTYVNGSNVFIEDATGGLLLYKSGHGFTKGDKINGAVTGKITFYGGFAEATDLDVSAATVTKEETVSPTVLTIDKLLAGFNRYVSCQVKLEGVKLDNTLSSSARNGNVLQGESTIGAYVKDNRMAGSIDKDVVGDLICYPCYNNKVENKQVGVWTPDHFTAE